MYCYVMFKFDLLISPIYSLEKWMGSYQMGSLSKWNDLEAARPDARVPGFSERFAVQ